MTLPSSRFASLDVLITQLKLLWLAISVATETALDNIQQVGLHMSTGIKVAIIGLYMSHHRYKSSNYWSIHVSSTGINVEIIGLHMSHPCLMGELSV